MLRSNRRHQLALLATLSLLLGILLSACSSATNTAVPAATTAAPVATKAPVATTAAAVAATTAPAAVATTAAPVAATTAAATASRGTILFGAPLSLTGSLNNESLQTKQGYDLWKDTVNAAGGIKVGGKAYQIEIKYYDDQSKQDLSAQQAERLIKEDKVNFLLGPYGTNSTKSMSAIAEQYKIPMVEGNGAAESIFSQGFKYTFGVLSPAGNYLKGAVEVLAAQNPKPKTVALLSANDSFSVEVADATKKLAEKNGMQVVLYEKYPDKETNLTSQVSKAKESNADVLLNSGHLNEAIAIAKAVKELKYNPQAMAFSVGPGLPEFFDNLKEDANYVLSGAQWTPVLTYKGSDVFATSPKYYESYKAKFGKDPSYQAASGTACGIAFQVAIEKAGTLDPAKVRDALAGLDIMTFYGQIKFDERGANIYKPMAVEQWQDGKKKTVFPADVAETKVLFPMPAWDKR